MAASKGRKTSTGTRGSNSTKNINSKAEDSRKIERQKEIYLFAFLAVSVFLLLSNFKLCGFVGNVISGFFFGLFGTITYLIPFYLFFSAAYLLSNGTNKKVLKKIIWVGIALLLVGFIMQLIAGAGNVTVKSLYMEGYKHKDGGGVIFGGLLSLLYKLIGKVGCIIFTTLFVIVAIIEIINISFIKLFKRMGSSIKETANYDYSQYEDEYDDERYEEALSGGKIVNHEPKHILNNTTILSESGIPVPEKPKRRKKKKNVEYPADEMMELNGDGTVKDIYVSGEDENDMMPEFLKDSHEKVKDRKGKRKKDKAYSAESDNDSEDAYNSINSLSFKERSKANGGIFDEPSEEVYNDLFSEGINDSDEISSDSEGEAETSEEIFVDNGSKVEKQPGRTGVHTRKQPIKTDIFDLKSGSGRKKSSFGESGDFVKSVNESLFGSSRKSDEVKIVDDDASSLDKDASGSNGKDDLNEEIDSSSIKEIKRKEYKFPPVSLLENGKSKKSKSNEDFVRENGVKLKETFESFGVNVTITDYSVGPAVTRFELQPEQGVKVSKIVGLQDDLKLALAAEDIRIEAPIPGKSAIGIEIPNKENQKVFFREVIDNDKFKTFGSNLAFAVGKDIGGQVVVTDIAKMPHLLIAGATGSGKSVCINTIIMSILYKAKPDDVKMIMIDPKMVELAGYNGIPHLLIPVVTDPKKAAGALNWAVVEMTKRYQLFAKNNVRNISGFNQKFESEGPRDDDPEFRKLPQIVVIVDELADLMMVAHAEVEDAIIRLCQLARAAGIHLIIATQRPSVDVITGLIKANVPSRIAFAVSSGVDSRTILDMNGAEKLLGKGDMLFYPTGYPKPVRVQGAFISDDEVVSIVGYIKKNNDGSYDDSVSESIENNSVSSSSQGSAGGDDGNRYDELFEDAARLVIEKDKASIGNLQRVFRIGFNRAARIMDQLSEAGVVGPEEGTKPRKILMTMDQFDDYISL
ncbi:DNA translocase FtsK [Eubacterium sp.]|uniref:FtsK/SpoIIIE family DNA translocase n=1 Tax=Eubacterium sp. TaxID=142586 RepID=UPI00258C61DE|nr:DNA translocase FtsK [Eubacterium sp.]MCR5367606.1 DNA translocase FtsK 4TM domain-containing protein [Eubacterium sp.]